MTDEELKKNIKEVMFGNLRQDYSKLLKTRYCYIQPAPGVYPFQWFWDTCFHAIILCELQEPELAKKILSSLFAMQEKNGFVGHMIFWKSTLPTTKADVLQARPTLRQIRPHMSAIVQPSFVAQTLLKIYLHDHDVVYLSTMAEKLENFLKWMRKNRNLSGEELLSIITPFESGMDFKASFDPLLGYRRGKATRSLYWRIIGVDLRNFVNRYDIDTIAKADYFLVEEVSFNTIYALDLSALAEIFKILKDAKKAAFYRELAATVGEKIFERMFDEEDLAFYDVRTRSGEQLKIKTPTILFPLALPNLAQSLAEKIIKKHLYDERGFDVRFPLPSVAIDEPAFDPEASRYIWRGGTWAFFNWFFYKCLQERGFPDYAETLKISLRQLIEQSGHREYYNPFTGHGYGAQCFTWSGLILDMH